MSWSFAKTPDTNTIYQDDISEKNVINCEAEAAVTPGALVAKGTSVGQVQEAVTGGALTVPIGIAGNNKTSVVTSTGLPIDPVLTDFAIGQTVPVVRHGLVLATASAGGTVTAGEFCAVSATAGAVATWTTGTQVGQALTTATANNTFIMDVNIVG